MWIKKDFYNKANHRIYKSQGGRTYLKDHLMWWLLKKKKKHKNDHKILQLSFQQEAWLILSFIESGLGNYLHYITAWKWYFNFPFLGMLALVTRPSCQCKELMPLALWAPSWSMSEPSWKGISFSIQLTKADPALNWYYLFLLSPTQITDLGEKLLLFPVISFRGICYATIDS